jgi:Trypsin
LIQLKENIRFTDTIKQAEFSAKIPPKEAILTLTGWGRLSLDGTYPNKLQTIDLKYVNYEKCKKLSDHESLFHNIDYRNVCTLNVKGEGACHADVGFKFS